MLAVVAVGSYYNGSVSFEGANYGRNPALYLVNALCGTLGLVFIFFALDMRIPPLEFYGRNTLIVLCTHLLIINAFWVINGSFLHLEVASVNAVLLASCVLLLEIPIIIVINRFFPFLLGRKY